MRNDRTALIGYGYWGKKIYRYLKTVDGLELSAVFFPSLKRLPADAIHKDYGSLFTPDIEPIWEDQSIGAVIIATPIDTHYSLVRLALSAGKHVLVEKPLTLSGEQAAELFSLARDKNRVLMTEYTYTFSQALQKAVELVRTGEIGRLRRVTVSLRQLGRFLPYDVFALLGSHALSIMGMFFDLTDCHVRADPAMNVEGVATSGTVVLRSADDQVQGLIDLSLNCPRKDRCVTVYGEEGTICYRPDAVPVLIWTRYVPSEKTDGYAREDHELDFDEGHNLRRGLEKFSSALRENTGDNRELAFQVSRILGEIK
ncbi:MAG: Gfo/Idh/MocA family protein [Candidatus Omnitrophota bacterium]